MKRADRSFNEIKTTNTNNKFDEIAGRNKSFRYTHSCSFIMTCKQKQIETHGNM